jgi:cyclophilin family peptidyl-prolyl cis-trans isomerase
MFKIFIAALSLALIVWGCLPNRHNNNKKTDTKVDSLANNSANIKRLDTTGLAALLTPDPFSALVELQTTVGTLKIELFFHTPTHRENFLKLAKENAYNHCLFHRLIKGFMAQTGDPSSKSAKAGARLGGGNIGKEQDAEINTQYFHLRGALAAARTSDEVNPEKKSSGSQFYIVDGRAVSPEQLDKNERKYGFSYTPAQRLLYQELGGAPQLDMEYTVFGRVYEGLPTLDSLMQQPTDKADRPTTDIKIIGIKVIKG